MDCKHRQFIRILSLALVLMMVLVWVGCGKSAENTSPGKSSDGSALTGDTITIGAVMSLSGQFANLGKIWQDGWNWWKDEVNAAGGITVNGKKYKVDIKIYDDQSDPATSARMVTKLIDEDGIKIILGSYGTANVQASSAEAEKRKAIYINDGGSSMSLWKRGFKYFFGATLSPPEYLTGFLDLMKKKQPDAKRLVILYSNAEFTTQIANAHEKYAKENGFEVVGKFSYPQDAKDVSALIAQAKALKPDILIGCTYDKDSILITRQAKEGGLDVKAMAFSVGPSTKSYFKSLGKDAEYVFGSNNWHPSFKMDSKNTLLQGWVDKYTAKVGHEPDYHDAYAIDGAEFVRQAIEYAQSIDPEKVREALATQEFHTPSYNGKFGSDGRGTSVVGRISQVQDGKSVLVWPEEYVNALKLPVPPWSQR